MAPPKGAVSYFLIKINGLNVVKWNGDDGVVDFIEEISYGNLVLWLWKRKAGEVCKGVSTPLTSLPHSKR